MKKVCSFSERLKKYMSEHNNMTYEQLSILSGFPAQTLNRYALGQRVPKIDDCTRLAEKLNVSSLWLQGFDEDILQHSASFEEDELLIAYSKASFKDKNMARMALDLPPLEVVEDEFTKEGVA